MRKSYMLQLIRHKTVYYNNAISFLYLIDNEAVERCIQFKDLGVIFDSTLTFVSYINFIVSNAFKNLGFIFRHSKMFKNLSTLSILFDSFVRPKLE